MKLSLLHGAGKLTHRRHVLSTYQFLQEIHSIRQLKTSNGL